MRMMSQPAQRGVSLIEVLVAVAVLSVGFVGYAALQMIGVRTNNESLHRTQAIMAAQAMVERMYSNRSAITDPAVNGGASLYDGLTSEDVACGTPPTACDRGRNTDPVNCSINETVQWDLYSAFCGPAEDAAGAVGGIADVLLDAELTVTCVPDGGACTPTSIHVVRVEWQEFETDGDPQADQDDDGNNDYMTRQVQLEMLP